MLRIALAKYESRDFVVPKLWLDFQGRGTKDNGFARVLVQLRAKCLLSCQLLFNASQLLKKVSLNYVNKWWSPIDDNQQASKSKWPAFILDPVSLKGRSLMNELGKVSLGKCKS